MVYMYVQRLVSLKFPRPQITVVTNYRLKEPILHLLWGFVDMFFGYNFPKPEPMWMKSGIQVTGHGEHSHK